MVPPAGVSSRCRAGPFQTSLTVAPVSHPGACERAGARGRWPVGSLLGRQEADMPALSRPRVMHPLIGSDRIEGTLVCGLDGAQLGTVERLMINKISGQVAYAVVECMDHPFVGKMRFPIRWDALTYDRRRGAYLVDMTADEIRRAPAVDGGFDWGDRTEVVSIRHYR